MQIGYDMITLSDPDTTRLGQLRTAVLTSTTPSPAVSQSGSPRWVVRRERHLMERLQNQAPTRSRSLGWHGGGHLTAPEIRGSNDLVLNQEHQGSLMEQLGARQGVPNGQSDSTMTGLQGTCS